MVWTIAPAVSGDQRRRVVAIHSLALVAGALTTGLALILVASAVAVLDLGSPPWLRAVAAGVLLAWALRAVTQRGLAYPRSHWQVPESWRARLPLKATAAGYGYLLGLGPLTDVILPAYWLLVGISAAAVLSVPWALAAWVGYGATRAAATLAGIRGFASTCNVDGTPASGVRLGHERAIVLTLTVLLFITVASLLLADTIP